MRMGMLPLVAVILGLLAPRQARSAGHDPPPRLDGASRPQVQGLALPGCPERCGDVTIPYPFGIGENCSYSGFELQCNRTSAGVFLPQMSLASEQPTTPVVNISLSPPQVRILVNPFSTCSPSTTDDSSNNPLGSERFRLNIPFTLSNPNMNISNWTYTITMDWSIRNFVDDMRLRYGGTYSWRGNPGSQCLLSPTGFGHTCKCVDGFQGNPYLPNGCQDIDECQEPNICEGGRICTNRIGSHACVCPDGTIDKGNGYPCTTKSQMYRQLTFGMALGFGIALGLLLILGGCTLVHKGVQRRKVEQYRLQLFKKNRDMLIEKQSCGSENIVERIKFFPLSDLEKATNNFDKTCVVGKGGHGTVYKALLNLQVVAIKISNVATESEIEEFINEVILLSQVNHRNVVKLIGCCLETEVPLLVYEFISNGTLFDHIHIQNETTLLSWEDRLRIATEMTSALAYLHSAANVSIFHRDIKTSNILLDERLTAKISDFGASKSIASNQTHYNKCSRNLGILRSRVSTDMSINRKD